MTTALMGVVPAQLTLGVADLEVSQTFYGAICGFSTRREGHGLVIDFPSFRLILIESPPPERAKLALSFHVDEPTLEAIADRVRSAAGSIAAGPDRRDGGGRALFVTDPDHYTVEFFTTA